MFAVAGAVGYLAGPAALATVLVFGLVVVQPFAGRRRYRKLVERIRRQPAARVQHYVGGIVGEWVYVGVVAIIGGFAGRNAASIGLTVHELTARSAAIADEYMVLTAIGMVVTTVLVWKAGPQLLEVVWRQVRGFVELLPRTLQERLVFVALAVTAGICEEILYRGFGIAYTEWLIPGVGRPAIIVLTGAAFGLAHAYQGPRNVLLTGVVGGMFAWLTLTTGTLVPAMIIHALVDLRVAALPSTVAAEESRQPV
jgi:membrane protease YdiL (CAAX protease family)